MGSDVDLPVIVTRWEGDALVRAAAFDTTQLPVPADVFVYTVEEWDAMASTGRFRRQAERDAVWVYP